MSLGGAVKTFRGFCVAKDDLRRWRWEERDAPVGDLAAGQILVGADKFAFTANNVTYARLGDQIAYWRFFPAPQGWATSRFGVSETSFARAIPRCAMASASMAIFP